MTGANQGEDIYTTCIFSTAKLLEMVHEESEFLKISIVQHLFSLTKPRDGECMVFLISAFSVVLLWCTHLTFCSIFGHLQYNLLISLFRNTAVMMQGRGDTMQLCQAERHYAGSP